MTRRLSAQEAATAGSTVMTGSPALTITDHLLEPLQNLVAICTHGRSGVGKFVIRIVADTIIRSARVQMLVFAAPTEE